MVGQQERADEKISREQVAGRGSTHDPVIEQRLRVLAEATGRKQSFFLQQMIEEGIEAMEEIWLSPQTLAKVRNGDLPELLDARSATSDLFDLDGTDATRR